MTEENKYPQVDFDYASGLAIDEHHLELELVSIAKDIMAVSEAHVQAMFNRDRAKQRRDVEEAQLDRIARTDPYPADLPISEKTKQPTETAILNWVHKQDEYQAAQKERQEAEYVVNMLQAAVFAYQAKKTALENLVKLYGLKYYAEPYLPADSKAGVDAAAMDRGREAMSGELAKEMVPAPQALRDKGGFRYAVGPITEHGQHAFEHGPFPELSQALDCIPGGLPAGIYKLTRNQPDELIYVWDMKLNGSGGWVEESKQEAPKALPPRPGATTAPPTSRPPLLRKDK